ncbi:MAG: hypothetical protein IKI11_11875 [Neisseriaceae bacterium]|nr:hypothetical protein [Neisseriaceae bacterium]
MSEKELFKIQLKSNKKEFKATGNTRHYANDGLLPEPIALSIVQYDGDSGFYLFYLDETGNEQTDTYHDNLDNAFKQAEFEFGIKKSDWTKLS